MARIKSNTEGALRIFRIFKQDYCMEGYLLLLPNLRLDNTSVGPFRATPVFLTMYGSRGAGFGAALVLANLEQYHRLQNNTKLFFKFVLHTIIE